MASASLLLALRLMDVNSGCGPEPLWNRTIQHYTTYAEEHVRPIMRRLAMVVREAPNSKLRAVFNKYKNAKLAQISTHPQLGAATQALDRVIAECSPLSAASDSDEA